MYIYIRTEFSPYQLYTVGHYDPDGRFIAESDWGTTEEAAKRVHYLNGGKEEQMAGWTVVSFRLSRISYLTSTGKYSINMKDAYLFSSRIHAETAAKRYKGTVRNQFRTSVKVWR